MSTDLMNHTESELTPLTKENIKAYLAPQANDQELTLFLELCKAQELNPFIKEAYLVVYKMSNGTRKSSIITGKDVFTKRAQAHPDFEGFRAGVILIRNNLVTYQEGSFKLKTDQLVGGWAEVHKKGLREPIREEVSMDEYSSGQSTWKAMPATMIRKVALVHALREAFPDKFSGLYDESELAAIKGQTIDVPISKKELDTPITKEREVEIKNAIEKSTKTIEEICQAYRINNLSELGESKAPALLKRLGELEDESN